MRPTSSFRLLAARILSAILALTMTFGPVTAAYGAPTPLADVPIAAKVTAKPNIIYTLDDSGSMQYNYIPDYLVNAAATITITITRAGSVATATGAVSTLNVGDWVNIIGANQPEYNGFVQITAKPIATQFKYNVPGAPATPATIAPGYGNIQVVTSAAYCRLGNTTTTCPQQAVNIASTGTAIATTSITRPGPIGTGGLVTATATGTAANFLPLNTGDTVLIQHTAAGAPPGTTSDPYYGVFTITKTSTTTFTYQINAVAGVTPLAAGGNRQVVVQGGSAFAPPPMHAADFNRMAYNPAVTYTAPKKADGTPLTNTGTDANGNYAYNALKWATPTVDRDPFAAFETAAGVTPMWPAATKDDLSIKVQVSLYCNTDWPTLVNDPNGPATALDAGDVNGQYQATKGAWCRINGTKYDASPTSGAPAAAADYNYPWQSSSGANGAQYFYRQLTNKVLWCDTTSPWWPRNGVISGCTAGGTPTGGFTYAQSCYQTGTPNVCTGSYPALTYKDTATGTTFCDNSATWCSPPGIGTSPECKACTCVPNTPSKTAACHSNGTLVSGVGAPPAAGTGGSGANCGCVGAGCALTPAVCTNVTSNPTGCSSGNPIFSGPAGSAACTAVLWDYAAGVYSGQPGSTMPATTLLQDANGQGLACRHNNQTYAVGGVAGLFKYSATTGPYPGDVTPAGAAQGQLGKFQLATTSSCPTVGTTVYIPRHYYVIDSVQYCNDRIVTADVQWRGFGAGTCQTQNDLANFQQVKFGQFTRVDLFPTNALAFPGNSQFAASTTPYPKGPPATPSNRVWLAPVNPGPDNSESINYANWYAYYSTRLNAAKSASSQAFSYLTNVPPDPVQYRVGFHNLGEEPVGFGGGGTPIIWLDVADWDLAQRNLWYGKLFGISVSTYKTPTLDAMMRIGNLVETGGAGGLPGSINPLPGSAKDPFDKKPDGTLVSCMNNYHILFTDGKTNQVSPITTPGDQDQVVPASLSLAAGNPIQKNPPDNVLETLAPLAGAAWPAPFKQGVAIPNTLADAAAYYWTRDLRPTLTNDVPASSSKAPFDVDPTRDVAWWQHVNFSAISFGAEGTLDAGNQSATLAAIVGGSQKWPDLTQPFNPVNPKGAGAGAVAVDDLWHATVMSRGSFVFARSPIEVSYGLANILAGIQNQRKSRSGAAFSGQVLDAAHSIIFEPTIEPGWAGDLLKVQIDPVSGKEVQPNGTWWQASVTLKDQIDPVKQGVPEPWMDPVHRRIVTLTGAAGPGVPFQFGNLTASMLLSLAPDVTQQKKIISYLRGGNTWTDPLTSIVYNIEGTSIGQFRKRFGVMGDISNAQPVVVSNPDYPYSESTDPGYTAYKTANASRKTRVVAPANDGMVHVFDAGPMPKDFSPPAFNPGGGTEVFAFIPRALFKGVAGTVNEDATGIQALTYQDGGVPIYHHHMYVDSSPRVADIYDGANWRTIVVGGLGKGGPSYYALDLTNAAAADETQAANKVMWEWNGKDENGVQDVKYSYGRPVIVKVRDSAYPNGRWVVIVTGGYNNVSKVGKVFFLDAVTGVPISSVTATPPSVPPGADDASGLAQIHAFVANENNQIAEQIYGGDLYGNVWRIDVSAPNQYKAATAVLFAQLTDPAGKPQPVTVAPQIEIDISNGVDRYVFIGTGRLLDTSDLTTPSPAQQQTMYAIRDGTLKQFSTSGLPIQPRVTMAATNPDGVSAVAGGAPNGWYHDLPNNPAINDTERIVVDPESDVNVAAYVGTLVQNDPCLIALPAKLYARDYTTGEALTEDSMSGAVVPFVDFPQGLVSIATLGLIQPDGSQLVGIIGMKEVPGAQPAKIVNKFSGVGNRLSWKLLGGE